MSELSETTVSLPWQASNPQSTSQNNKLFKKRKPLVYGVASVKAKAPNPVPTRNSGYKNNTEKTLNENMLASKLLIEKLQEEVKELKSGGLPTLKDLQEQVDIMIEKSEVKVDKMWNETSKFVNSLEDKVLEKQENWVREQEEVLVVQDLRLTTLEKYNIDLEKYKISCEEKRIKWIEETEETAERHRKREERIRAILTEDINEYQVVMDKKMTKLEGNTYTREQTRLVVEMLQSKREHNKVGENNQTNPNLKRDSTHVIVSQLKKSRQTKEDSGLMQTE